MLEISSEEKKSNFGLRILDCGFPKPPDLTPAVPSLSLQMILINRQALKRGRLLIVTDDESFITILL